MTTTTSAMSKAPALSSERLVLRAHRVDDFEPLASMWAEPEVVRYIGGKPMAREDVWSRLLRSAGHWQLLGFGYWVVCEKATGALLGEVGFADFRRDIEPGFHGVPEIGWALISRAHGQGLGTEAVRLALAWGDAHFTSTRSVCLIDAPNAPSRHLAKKCGFVEWCHTSYHGEPSVLFERTSPLRR